MDVGKNMELTKEEAIEYVQSKIDNAIEVFDTNKEITGQVVLKTEGVEGRKVQKVDITLNVLGRTIKQSEHSRSMKRAIDRACGQLVRQIRKVKTKTVDKKRKTGVSIRYREPEFDIKEFGEGEAAQA
jgi:ribosomal subunit interface protein